MWSYVISYAHMKQFREVDFDDLVQKLLLYRNEKYCLTSHEEILVDDLKDRIILIYLYLRIQKERQRTSITQGFIQNAYRIVFN